MTLDCDTLRLIPTKGIMETWTHKYVAGRKTRDGYLVVTAGLSHIQGNARPYFSVTAELWDSEGWYRNGQDGRCREGGCLHDRILKAFPELAPVVACHLADDTGTPMHAAANSLYWLNKGDRAAAARTLAIDLAELPTFETEAEHAAFVAALRPYWRLMAARAIETLDRLAGAAS